MLRVRVLGGFELRLDGEPVPALESARAESLLTYLVLHRAAPQPRQRIAALLWPESTQGQALTNLRHVLHNVREGLRGVGEVLDVTPRTLQWRPETPCELDVAEFEDAVGRGDLRAAVDGYPGDLLEANDDEWLVAERDRLRVLFFATVRRLAQQLADAGAHAHATVYAARLVRADPLDEAAHRLLIGLYDAQGDRARALRAYHACAATLERELGVRPSAQTRAVRDALLTSADTGGHAAQQTGPPLVGRAAQRARLTELWQQVRAGDQQAVLVTGEPGIGKSRLVEAFRSWCAHRGAVTAEARSYQAEGTLAYGLVAAWLRSGGYPDRVRAADRPIRQTLARLLPELLTETPDLAAPRPMPPAELRQQLFDAAARVLLSPGGPVLLVADDLQWCDAESLRFLHYLLRSAPQARLLIAGTARTDELQPPHPLLDLITGLVAMRRQTELALPRLDAAETALLAGHLLQLAGADAARLHAQTDGNPLFVLEAVRAGWPATTDTGPRVQAIIAQRLAQLSGPAAGLAGLAATIGREFTADVLAEAGELGQEQLVGGLDELWRRRVIRDRGVDAYDFSHGAVRDAAYAALSPIRRRSNHLRVAKALEPRAGADPQLAETIAAHYDSAGTPDPAVDWYLRAADVATLLCLSTAAVRLIDRAIELLRALPGGPRRDERELAALTALLGPLGTSLGFGADRMVAAERRAVELATGLGAEPAAPLLRGLAVTRLALGDFADAGRYAAELRDIARHDVDEVLSVEAEYVLGISAYWQGRFGAARQHFESVVARYRPEHRDAHLLRYGFDPRAVCLSRLANTLGFLGDRAAAVAARAAALDWAEQIGHNFSRSAVAGFGAVLALDLDDVADLRGRTADLIALRDRDPSMHHWLIGEAMSGCLDVLDGRAEEGLPRVRRAAAQTTDVASMPGHEATIHRVLLAACVAANDVPGGLAAAERLLTMGRGAAIWEAEVRRLRAELLAADGAPAAEVAAELERSVTVARAQGAALFERRAERSRNALASSL